LGRRARPARRPACVWPGPHSNRIGLLSVVMPSLAQVDDLGRAGREAKPGEAHRGAHHVADQRLDGTASRPLPHPQTAPGSSPPRPSSLPGKPARAHGDGSSPGPRRSGPPTPPRAESPSPPPPPPSAPSPSGRRPAREHPEAHGGAGSTPAGCVSPRCGPRCAKDPTFRVRPSSQTGPLAPRVDP